jgi:hypothetical protein
MLAVMSLSARIDPEPSCCTGSAVAAAEMAAALAASAGTLKSTSASGLYSAIAIVSGTWSITAGHAHPPPWMERSRHML